MKSPRANTPLTDDNSSQYSTASSCTYKTDGVKTRKSTNFLSNSGLFSAQFYTSCVVLNKIVEF